VSLVSCCVPDGAEKCVEGLVEKSEGKRNLTYLDVNGNIVL